MALSHSPQVVTNGLVFYYDMANGQKSWRGAPTTNLVNPSWAAWSIDGSGQGSIGTRTITSTYECIISDTAANTRQNAFVPGISANTTYTFSVQYKKVFGAPTLRFQITAYNGATQLSNIAFPTTAQIGLLDIEGWQTAKFTVTTPANTTQILWFMQDGDDYTAYTHSFILANAQCELGSIATPFVVGTRTNTQAIVDLIGNNTVTANSLTYASDNTFSFNGSNNYVTISSGSNFTFGAGDFTLETWYMPNVSYAASNGYIFDTSVNGTRLQLYNNNFTFVLQSQVASVIGPAGAGLNINTWHHAVGTRVGSTLTLYLNGVSVGTSTSGANLSDAGGTIGEYGGFGPYYFNGQISIIRVYKNKGLTASEVQQNFNAQRGRYGI